MPFQLEETLATLTAKVEALQEELEAESKAANGALFESPDPLRNQHVVSLSSHTKPVLAGVPGSKSNRRSSRTRAERS